MPPTQNLVDSPGPRLTVAGLAKSFPLRGVGFARKTRLRAVDDVSFSLWPGKTLALVGESGSGKSTVARILAGIESADGGQVRLDGEDLLSLRKRDPRGAARAVQMVFQDPGGSLDPRFTVHDIVAEPLRVHRLTRKPDTRARIEQLLSLVGLDASLLDRHPHALSGGQKQRVAIARALALSPRVLIADEPIAALDVSVAAQIVNLLVELQERLGLSLLFISHDLRVVQHLAAETAVMQAGRIVEHAPTPALFAAPTHPYTRTLLAAAPRLPQDA